MKQNNFFKALVLLAILVINYNCSDKHLIEEETIVEQISTGNTEIKHITDKDAPNVISTITSLTGKGTYNKGIFAKGIVFKKAFIDFYDILKVTNREGITNYTFKITLENAPEGEFYNLIINEDASGNLKPPYVIKYASAPEALDEFLANNKSFSHFKGTRTNYSFDDFFQDTEITGKGSPDPSCLSATTPIDNISENGSDGDFHSMSSGGSGIQTNPYLYSYSSFQIPGFSYSLTFNTYNSGQTTSSHSAIVANPVSNITAGGVNLTINTPITGGTVNTGPTAVSVTVTYVTGGGGGIDSGGASGGSSYIMIYTV